MNAEIPETLAGKVHRQVIASMVAVRAGRSRGSGVFVGENEVVTNCHVIDTGEVIDIFPATPGPDSTSAAGRIVAALDCDLCLLKVDGLSGEPATIGDAEKLRLGDSVFAVGFPEYPSETLSSGIISRLSSEEDIFPKPEIQTTAPFHFGMSGGGLFNEAGELIGIPALSEGRGENKNLAVSARHVSQLRENADFEEFWHSTLPNALSAPNPHQLRNIAHGIAQPSNDPLRAAYNWQDIGCEEAKAQNYPGAKFALDHMLGKENSEDVEVRDAVAAAASEIYAHLGIFDKALRHAEKINDQFLRMEHLAIVAKERARTGDWKAARKILDRIGPVEVDALTPFALANIAEARAETGEVGKALELNEALVPHFPDGLCFCLYVATLASVAASLFRQGGVAGAAAIFNHAEAIAASRINAGTGWDRFALADVASEAADCGDFRRVHKILGQMAEMNNVEFRSDLSYPIQLIQLASEVRTRAKIGDIAGGLDVTKRMPVLDANLCSALVSLTNAMNPMTEE